MSNQPIGGVPLTGGQIANSRYGAQAPAVTAAFDLKKKSANEAAAKLLADYAKKHPLVSPGVATGLALAGIPATSEM